MIIIFLLTTNEVEAARRFPRRRYLISSFLSHQTSIRPREYLYNHICAQVPRLVFFFLCFWLVFNGGVCRIFIFILSPLLLMEPYATTKDGWTWYGMMDRRGKKHPTRKLWYSAKWWSDAKITMIKLSSSSIETPPKLIIFCGVIFRALFPLISHHLPFSPIVAPP